MGTLYKHITPAMKRKANHRGYWIADEVLRISRPDYDDDNIARETARLFGDSHLFAPRADPGVLPTVNAPYDEIQRCLEDLR